MKAPEKRNSSHEAHRSGGSPIASGSHHVDTIKMKKDHDMTFLSRNSFPITGRTISMLAPGSSDTAGAGFPVQEVPHLLWRNPQNHLNRNVTGYTEQSE